MYKLLKKENNSDVYNIILPTYMDVIGIRYSMTCHMYQVPANFSLDKSTNLNYYIL